MAAAIAALAFSSCKDESFTNPTEDNLAGKGTAAVTARLTSGDWKLTATTLRYSDGTVEFEGGSIHLVEPVVLPLGPVEITVTAISGTENQYGRVKFVKNGHEYVIIECRINGGAYVELGMANKSPFIDDRPLLVPGVAEIREYRARYYDNAAPSSGWSDVAKVTVGP